MLKIRLMRIGAKKRPFYRVVAVDERNKRTGGYIENLGTYNPLTEPKEIKLNQERIDYWTKKGAQMSVGFLRIIGKAPQRQPRKPKKPAKQAPAPETAPAAPAEPEKSEPSQTRPENQKPGEPDKPEVSLPESSEQSPQPEGAGQPKEKQK